MMLLQKKFTHALAHALTLTLLFAAPAFAQAQKPYWVFFKPAITQTKAAPALSSFALANRQHDHIQISNEDRPIPARLTHEITSTGAHLRTQSRWLRAISVDATGSQLEKIKMLRDIASVSP